VDPVIRIALVCMVINLVVAVFVIGLAIGIWP